MQTKALVTFLQVLLRNLLYNLIPNMKVKAITVILRPQTLETKFKRVRSEVVHNCLRSCIP